ncbi:hypothetical protein [Tissierella sp. Yu-01]|uniref:hypothetical protein n=1 Tax=Tissierella sp. Yu-01 TaxID=3035694 RepID=UPI00240CE6AD|nr:hypothetical protein [Tissierella sp. Yu-01]WFA09571.1 hypothetical protein P3962_03185 [Tissierella sp. Yu-01]
MKTTIIIKRKSDIDNLLNKMPKGSKITVPAIFGGYGKGVFEFEKVDNNTFKNQSSGQNWKDKEVSNVDRECVIKAIWENRKAFNQHKKDLISSGFPIIDYH